MVETFPKTYFLKPAHIPGQSSVLNDCIVKNNIAKGVETSVLLDTNVLINMEQVVMHENNLESLEKYGLMNLVDFLNQCPQNSIAISPGFAFGEMPPGLAEKSRELYELFCSAHLPTFVDYPCSIRTLYEGKERDYGFWDLAPPAQAFLSIPFCALIYMIIADKEKYASSFQKFQKFLQHMSEDLDVLSAKEIEIAKYCFFEPKSSSMETIRMRKILRKNFLKTKNGKSIQCFDDVMRVAYNGASDISIINYVNALDGKLLDGVVQDCWIATCDSKLFECAKVMSYLKIDGEMGKYTQSNNLSDQIDDPYWRQVNLAHWVTSERRLMRHLNREVDLFGLIDKAALASDSAKKVFD